MSTLQSSTYMFSSSFRSSCCQRGITRSTIKMPKLRKTSVSLPKLQTRGLVEELELMRNGYKTTTYSHIEKYCDSHSNTNTSTRNDETEDSDPMVIMKLYEIMEAIADRVEMHKNIGEQRNNWNSLLLTSINTITLAAATMAAIAATSGVGAPLMALKLSSSLMYLASTAMLLIMNKIQPSQLAEEQRNAARFFKKLGGKIRTIVAIGTPKVDDVNEAIEEVLALDKAYPLPLIGVMLEKFPSSVEPAVWWPQRPRKQAKMVVGKMDGNGWNGALDDEMRQIVEVIKRKDKDDYLRLGEKFLKLNKFLAISGPLLTGLAAVGSAFVGTPSHGCWAVVVAVVGGGLASIVNTMEHGVQVGMVFEMYRSNAGFFRLMEESIESNLKERDVGRRENGELFEMKVALELGRSLSELKDLSDLSTRKGKDIEEFASKLF